MDRPKRAQFDKICRLCLKSANLVNIFDRNPRTQKESLSVLVLETVEMLGLTIEADDEFPKKMCISCKDFLRQLFKFRNQCREANDLLVEAISTSDEQSSTIPADTSPQLIRVKPSVDMCQQDVPSPKCHDADVLENEQPGPSKIEQTILEADSSSSSLKVADVKNEMVKTPGDDSCEPLEDTYEYLEPETEPETHDALDIHEQADDVQEVYTIEEHQENEAYIEGIEIYVESDVNNEDETIDTQSSLDDADVKPHSVKGQMCKVCGKYSTSLKSHMMCHTGERPFSCDQCDKSFRTVTKLKIHVDGVHLKLRKHTCEVCQKKFLDAGNLRNHMVTHGGDRKYICDHEGCGKMFALQGTLTVHQKSHTQDKQFTCHHCDKAFLYKWLLKKHLRTHTGERPYACDICPKSFTTSTHLNTHKKIHARDNEKKVFTIRKTEAKVVKKEYRVDC